MRFYWLRPSVAGRHTGEINAAHRWKLPGVTCPACGATWGGGADAYPSVDLSELAEQALLEEARLAPDFAEFERLCERVRPLAPPGVPLRPGTGFGPLVGTAQGTFGPLAMPYDWMLLVYPETFAHLNAAGIQGLKGCPTLLRFRQKRPPALLEVQIEPGGLLHPDCLPPGKAAPCARCGRHDFGRPDQPLLAASSLPADRDLFRLANSLTTIVTTERLADAVRRLNLDDVQLIEFRLR